MALKEVKASVMMASFYQTQSNMVLHVLMLVSLHTWVVKGQGEWLHGTCNSLGYLVDCSTENLSHSCMKRHIFLMIKELLCAKMAYQITAEMVPSPHSSPNLSCLFMHPKLLPNAPQWNNCSYLPLSVSHNTELIMRKCDAVCWVFKALSHVHCHTGLPNHVKSCKVIKCRHNEINKYISLVYSDFSYTLYVLHTVQGSSLIPV